MALLQKAYLGSTALWRGTGWYEDAPFNRIDTGSATTVTADNSAHTLGGWSPLIASTSADASLLQITVTGVNAAGTNTATLLNLGIGAPGDEVIIAENIAIGSASTVSFNIPFKLPSGTRIAAQIRSVVTGGKTASITAAVLDAGNYAATPTSVDIIGGNTANSQGISFSGASGNWTVAIASTTRAYRAIGIVPSGHNSVLLGITPLFEIGVGASGGEVVFGQVSQNYTNAEATTNGGIGFVRIFGRDIPSGSRLAVRHDIAANPERYGFTLIGIP
jgi:hypothetical protein